MRARSRPSDSHIAQTVQRATLALGRPAGAWWTKRRRRPPWPWRLGRREVVVEQARMGRGAAPLVQPDHLEDPAAPLPQRNLYIVTGADRLGRLGRLIVDVDLSAVAGVRGETSSLEYASGPQPFVDPQRIHGLTVS